MCQKEYTIMNDYSYRYEKSIRSRPRIWHPGYLIHRIIHAELLFFANFINRKNDGSVLDFGCGKSPFRTMFRSYIGADLDRHKKEPDLIIDPISNRINTLNDNSVNNIISIQVIEHVPEIKKYIQEANRLLKPNGYLFIMAPFLYNFHGTDDYARYTVNFFERSPLFQGFEVTRINFAPNDFIVFVTYQLNHFLELFPVLKFFYPLFIVTNILALITSKITYRFFWVLGKLSPKFTILYRDTFLLFPLQISVILKKKPL